MPQRAAEPAPTPSPTAIPAPARAPARENNNDQGEDEGNRRPTPAPTLAPTPEPTPEPYTNIPPELYRLTRQGALFVTDRSLDVGIVGMGSCFLTVTAGDEFLYTKSGNMYIDLFGYLVTADGYYVQGAMLLAGSDSERLSNDPKINWGQDFWNLHESLWLSSISIGTPGDRGKYFGEGGMFGRVVVPNHFRNIRIDESGLIMGENERGDIERIAVVILTTFDKPENLTRAGCVVYRANSQTGFPDVNIPGSAPCPSGFVPGTLDMEWMPSRSYTPCCQTLDPAAFARPPLDTVITDEDFFVIRGDDTFFTRIGNLYLDPYIQGMMFLCDYLPDENP